MSNLQNFKRIAVHAKQLFLHASSHAGSSQPVDQMIALHDMHNAIEWLLAGMWAYHYEAEDKPFSMMQVYDKISKDKQRLILRREISLLNEARNQAQHHAIPPSPEALQKHLGYCEAFLRQSMRDLSAECEYDELYLGLLLPEGLGFRVEWKEFSEDWIAILGGHRIPAQNPFNPDVEWWVLLDLRTMVIQAERLLPATRSESRPEKKRAVRLVMNILGACLIYAQNLAIRSIDSLFYQDIPEAEAGPAMNSYPEGSPFPHLWGNDTNIGFGVGDLLDFFGQGVVGDGVEQRIVVALEALALGLDQAHLRRFQAFLYQANEPTADVINRGDLLWCYDFVLEALLTLAPLVQRTSDGIREVIFPNVWP